jgi:hypothetical protein
MRAVVLLVVLLVACSACVDYAQVSRRNAPGNVELSQPPPHENGDPARYDPPSDPGSENVVLFVAPYLIGGLGRDENAPSGVGEAGLEFRYERAGDSRMADSTWGIGAGAAFAQWGEHTRTVAPGAFYGEFSYRFVTSDFVPIDLAAGPLYYVDNSSFGGQFTARFFCFMLRSRYVANTGFELLGGAEIPIPFFFGWSK